MADDRIEKSIHSSSKALVEGLNLLALIQDSQLAQNTTKQAPSDSLDKDTAANLHHSTTLEFTPIWDQMNSSARSSKAENALSDDSSRELCTTKKLTQWQKGLPKDWTQQNDVEPQLQAPRIQIPVAETIVQRAATAVVKGAVSDTSPEPPRGGSRGGPDRIPGPGPSPAMMGGSSDAYSDTPGIGDPGMGAAHVGHMAGRLGGRYEYDSHSPSASLMDYLATGGSLIPPHPGDSTAPAPAGADQVHSAYSPTTGQIDFNYLVNQFARDTARQAEQLMNKLVDEPKPKSQKRLEQEVDLPEAELKKAY